MDTRELEKYLQEKGIYEELNENEDGSDCYSSVHKYMKITLENLLKMRKRFA